MKGTNLKKLTCITVFLFLAGAMVFATGNRQPAASTGTPTLQIGMNPTNVSDYVDNYLTQYLEKLHNVKLTFYMFPQGADFNTRLSLLAASDDLPETVLSGTISNLIIEDLAPGRFRRPARNRFVRHYIKFNN